MIRGEIWTVAGGVFASKPRPALVIQDDRFSDSESLTVLPMTSTLRDAPLLRIPVTPSDLSGLVRESHIMIDKITTVRRSNVQSRVGRLTSGQLVEVERALLVFLGIA
ncbi:type II toxin-antitoxin system PemK/MazF family toxin [Arthrobacter sp. B2a2-09]|uniref:type II toxin-antitoxin system PemK/MazF family toxin n=1 Tax=Arthrobacter sp. B2a2-09 TaxID=2952822 RepID=UPI0022CDB9CA|nr:type II toxin-antitoxin system PemK/MazF family toxin [Arthrobacter sp. B2a2-09]MCZ9884404.1 type II toxin-antitoxin system PemK/MazF family toxin [Arthrobacter sp. B2a2-09]